MSRRTAKRHLETPDIDVASRETGALDAASAFVSIPRDA